MFCLEYLESNLDWLVSRLEAFRGAYVLFDCPGQAELYTHHTSFFAIAQRLQKLDYRVRGRGCSASHTHAAAVPAPPPPRLVASPRLLSHVRSLWPSTSWTPTTAAIPPSSSRRRSCR